MWPWNLRNEMESLCERGNEMVESGWNGPIPNWGIGDGRHCLAHCCVCANESNHHKTTNGGTFSLNCMEFNFPLPLSLTHSKSHKRSQQSSFDANKLQ
jgi:hypothetical protein